MADSNKTLAEIILNHVHVTAEERDQLQEIVNPSSKSTTSKSEEKK